MFLFENVSGILSGKWTKDGEPGEIFRQILLGQDGFGGLMVGRSKEGLSVGKPRYHVRWKEVRCSDYGVPQNRPRVLVVGIREDIAGKDFGSELAGSADSVASYIDNDHQLLPEPIAQRPWTIREILRDLEELKREPPNKAGGHSLEYSTVRRAPPANVEVGDWYLKDKDSWLTPGLKTKLNPPPLTEQEYSRHSARVLRRFKLILDGVSDASLVKQGLKTKKFAQRKLPADWGDDKIGVTVTSLPDDFVHYSEPRILTVREWARLQTFPDWFEFRGPRTTGGTRRAGNPSEGNWHRDVPRYTQIGNAVPVMLGYKLGQHLATRLQKEKAD